ncbi:hypothetical protein FKW77_004000 [Venturia effusa]|uniref:Uncharacterized protein n=1 Tax=Venturia effusa TaxID=50376 RepID=A0A517LAU7_9PEZI|nr:hypothetical protein FKW77_004000 [Venturia effusa]
MVLLGGLELLAGAYLINEHKKNKKEKARIQEEQANLPTSRSRPSRRRSNSPKRPKMYHEDRKYRSTSPCRYECSAKRRPHYDEPSSAKPTAAIVPPSYYHPPPPKGQHSPMLAYHRSSSTPPTEFAPRPLFHSPQAVARPLPPASPVSPIETDYHLHAPFDVPDGFSPEQRQHQPLYAHNYAPIHYPAHLAELGNPSVTGAYEPRFQYDDGLIYDERRNRHVRFAIPREGDETQFDVVHPRNVPPPPYSP